MKGSLPSPIVWLFNQTQASVVGWHQYAWRSPVTTSPRFRVKRHSLSVFLCLSRCYPSVHRWALQKSGPLHLIYISLSKRKQRNSEEKSICCKISLCRLCFNLFLIFFFLIICWDNSCLVRTKTNSPCDVSMNCSSMIHNSFSRSIFSPAFRETQTFESQFAHFEWPAGSHSRSFNDMLNHGTNHNEFYCLFCHLCVHKRKFRKSSKIMKIIVTVNPPSKEGRLIPPDAPSNGTVWTDVLGEWDTSKQVLSSCLAGVQHLSAIMRLEVGQENLEQSLLSLKCTSSLKSGVPICSRGIPVLESEFHGGGWDGLIWGDSPAAIWWCCCQLTMVNSVDEQVLQIKQQRTINCTSAPYIMTRGGGLLMPLSARQQNWQCLPKLRNHC